MAALQAQSLFWSSSSSSSSSSTSSRRRFRASLQLPSNLRLKTAISSLPKLPLMANSREDNTAASICTQPRSTTPSKDEQLVLSKMYALLAAIADRAEMHAIIGDQRNNWNHLLTNSVNSITLTAALMEGICSTLPPAGGHALTLSSTILFAAAAGMMVITSKIQPSQLAEEQRNATRLWKQLGRSIESTLTLRPPTELDVVVAMDKVLALEKAYPLPLVPGMLEKFPAVVEPARWWPRLQAPAAHSPEHATAVGNGWSRELEEEMRGILRVLKAKDERGYLRMANLVLNVNKTLAMSGPLLAGMAAAGSGLMGAAPGIGAVPAVLGVLAAAVNSLEHGGQVGMVFELFRNCGGYYRRLEEEIEANLGEEEEGRRENGELFEMKVALQLGRSVSELRDFGRFASPWPFHEDDDAMECAGKLF